MNGSHNTKYPHSLTVICFGEVLWDNLPSGRKPGGAPMNVAYHLNKMGLTAQPISMVGADQDGRDLLTVMESLQIDTVYCGIDVKHKTSTVEVTFNTNGDAAYDIVYPVAWDYIEYQNVFETAAKCADAFVFGSLASRNDITRSTLYKLLDSAPYRVFDVNLRKPHYDEAYIKYLLSKTDLLKVNYEELEVLTGWYGFAGAEEDMISILQEKSGIKEIIVTKGSQGASYFCENVHYIQPAYQVTVKDTVGSGDSFLAAFLSGRLKNRPIKDSLDYAAKVAAYITTLNGACPVYDLHEINEFQAL